MKTAKNSHVRDCRDAPSLHSQYMSRSRYRIIHATTVNPGTYATHMGAPPDQHQSGTSAIPGRGGAGSACRRWEPWSVVHGGLEEAGLAFVEGEPDAEGGATADLAFKLDATAVGTDDTLNDHQAQAGALLLGGVEGLEDAVDLLLRNAAAGVSHANPDAVGALAGLQGERAAFGHGLQGILDEVDEDLLDLRRVDRGDGQLARDAGVMSTSRLSISGLRSSRVFWTTSLSEAGLICGTVGRIAFRNWVMNVIQAG